METGLIILNIAILLQIVLFPHNQVQFQEILKYVKVQHKPTAFHLFQEQHLIHGHYQVDGVGVHQVLL